VQSSEMIMMKVGAQCLLPILLQAVMLPIEANSLTTDEKPKLAKNAVQDGFFYNTSVIVIADEDDLETENRLNSTQSPQHTQSVFLGPGMNLLRGQPSGPNHRRPVGLGPGLTRPQQAQVLQVMNDLAGLTNTNIRTHTSPPTIDNEEQQEEAVNKEEQKLVEHGAGSEAAPVPSGSPNPGDDKPTSGVPVTDNQISEAENEWMEYKAPAKETFTVTMDGMMEALMEVQRRGDRMMQGIQKQKRILSALEQQVLIEEERMREARSQRMSEEDRIKQAEAVRKLEEKKLQKLLEQRRSMEQDARRTEQIMQRFYEQTKQAENSKNTKIKEKQAIERSIVDLNEEKEATVSEVERMKRELVPLVEKFTRQRQQLQNINTSIKERKVELDEFKTKIISSTNSLNELRTTLTKEQQAGDKTDKTDKTGVGLTSLTTSSVELPFLLPILLVSVLGNLLAGGQYISAFLEENRRADTVAQLTQVDTRVDWTSPPTSSTASWASASDHSPNAGVEWASPPAPDFSQLQSKEDTYESMFAPEGYYNLPRHF